LRELGIVIENDVFDVNGLHATLDHARPARSEAAISASSPRAIMNFLKIVLKNRAVTESALTVTPANQTTR
jgi:hypothetical protein